MIFKLSNGDLCETRADFTFNELQIEQLIAGQEAVHELNYNIFNEAFLYLGRKSAAQNNFTTFYALDTFGRGVMIEFKKDEGKQGLGTQILHTTSLVATRCGEEFVNFCLGRQATDDETYLIKQFINCDYSQINVDTRVVIMARSFDRSVFSFGNYLADNKFAFKAIRYFGTKVNTETLIEFSVEFESFSKYSYGVRDVKNVKTNSKVSRKPTVFFHDIGHDDERWWTFLQKTHVITASYDNYESPICRGYNLLNHYVPGDVVIAYSRTMGVVGFGSVTSKGYCYRPHDLMEFSNSHYHTMSVQWEATLPFNYAIGMKRVMDMGLSWPVQTKQEIRYNKGIIDALLNEIKATGHKKKVA